jgi:1-acyl-sn-glycerol-3-phosphate acyltransferase
MPLKPLSDPKSLSTRIMGQIKGWGATIPLVLSLMVCNALQMASLLAFPFSRRLFRRINREVANAWWCACDSWGQAAWKIDVQITGDTLPHGENVLVVANHQSMTDITTLFRLARQKGRLGDLKWLVKDLLKYVPGVGWGLFFLDSIFLKRDWKTDRAYLEKTLAKYSREKIPIWTISFVEGTRVRPHKIEAGQAYARENNLPVLDHLLLPRTKGFTAIVHGLRAHLDAVYDTTIGYESGIPSLWQWAKGYVHRVHVHVVRHPMDSLPEDETALVEWLRARYVEKDQRLARFYETGSFGDDEAKV